MIKIFLAAFFAVLFRESTVPEVKVAGAMNTIMRQGYLQAHADLDTFVKENLYGLGPVEELKGEILVLNGEIFSSEKTNKHIINKRNKVSKAAMLVYSHVKTWKAVKVEANVKNYAELENLIGVTAKKNGYDTTVPFVFKIEAEAKTVSYHIIDWKKREQHTMENHKQFAYSAKTENSSWVFLGFYSTHHHSIFTHHTTNVHVHLMDEKTKRVGHLDNLELKTNIIMYFPVA